ncbi:MAG: hypothetical protein ACLVEL_03145 [Ruthenibacterium sp.]
MSNTQTTSHTDDLQRYSIDSRWLNKYKPGEWEDLEEDLALNALKRYNMEKMRQEK